MKSKVFDLNQPSNVKTKQNKTLDFIGLYRTAAETNKIVDGKSISNDNYIKDSPKLKAESLKNEQYTNRSKKKKIVPVDISQINIDGSSLNCSGGSNTPINDSHITSTPIQSAKNSDKSPKVKSIMKNSTLVIEDAMDEPVNEKEIKYRSKKRNKSVSFMLDDNEEMIIKKVKSDDTKNKMDSVKITKTKIFKKSKKDHNSEKENKNVLNQNTKKIIKSEVAMNIVNENEDNARAELKNGDEITTNKHKIKKILKKTKKVKLQLDEASNEAASAQADPNNQQSVESKLKKLKKKKSKTQLDEGEPATKSRKTEVKPDIIAEDLKNLIIGDNAHTLSNLLDDMTVADKNKHKKSKLKSKKSAPIPTSDPKIPTEGEKEKIKWKKRKWNKDKKGEVDSETLNTSVIVENLPLSIMLSYKKILADHFEKCGLIKRIGVAEVYPTEESKPVFTTTIHFCSDEAATRALEENNSSVEGSRIRVKRPLPPTETTVVLRTYAELNEQNVTSLFTGIGKIRNIRHLVKGRKAMCTAFVEFDGPETVEKAIRKAANEKIAGKRVHVAKYEIRTFKKKIKVDENDEHKNDSDDSSK